MKKIITTLVVGALFTSISFAQNLSFGIRGSAGIGFMSLDEKDKDAIGNSFNDVFGMTVPSSADTSNQINSGFAFWGNYKFLGDFAVQGELGFLFNNGAEIKSSANSGLYSIKINDKISYTTMELPILLTTTIHIGKIFEFIPQSGVYLSFPIGKCKEDLEASVNSSYKISQNENAKIDNSIFIGGALGADFAVNFSNTSAIMLNIRYMHDINKLKIDGDERGRRSMLLFSAGYRYTLK